MQQAPVFQNSSFSIPAPPPGGREWKEGLGNVAKATERRREENVSLRKARREHKFKERRTVPVLSTTQLNVQDMIYQHYNPRALLAYDVKQLHWLSQILGQIDEDMLEKHFEKLFDLQDGHVIRILLEALQKQELVTDAANCLANMTGQLANEKYMQRVCELFGKHNALKAIHSALLLKIGDDQRNTLWTLVCNISFAQGVRGAELLYLSPLMPALLEEIREANDIVAYPLVDIVRLLVQHVELAHEWMRIFYFVLCKRASEPLQLALGGELQSLDFEMTMSALVGLWLIFKRAQDALCGWFLQQDEPTWSMMRVFNQYLFQIQHKDLKYRIMALYNEMCSWSIEDHLLPKKILQHNCLQIFIQASQSNESEMRREALFCIGSFMAEGTQFVSIALKPPFNIMEALLPALRDRSHKIKIGSLYCCMTMFQVANEERLHNMSTSADCDALLRTLIIQYKIIHLVLPFLHQVMSMEESLIYDILQLIHAALVWNKPVVLQALEMSNGLDAFNQLANAVHLLKSQQNTQIFDLAMKIDDIISDEASMVKDEVMDLDIDRGLYQF